jgi:hypothetical protein
MSFGFSIGDFLTLFEQANKLRKRFVDAPAQFDALSEQYGLSISYDIHPLLGFSKALFLMPSN